MIMEDGRWVIVGDAAEIYETRDGGVNWKKIQVPDMIRQYWLRCAVVLGENKYMAFGSHGAAIIIEDSAVVGSRTE